MYSLTKDFTKLQLRVLADLLNEKIETTKQHIEGVANFIPDGDVKDDLLKKEFRYLATLRELSVPVLTSLQIVSDKELSNAN
jgi:hypothetical protein